ncbi:uncharacterized protein LOC141619266 [Silene latifolia]|uniref:uncharacterized protein LOC141619266 n=1 Tax=Silene latifolia TaxID=37657 RepID=UPI003D7876EB
MQVKPPAYTSWYWRKVCQIRDTFDEALQQQLWSGHIGREYSIAKGYEWLREKGDKVQWSGLVWNKWSFPKHSFLVWIYQHGNLNTNAKLFSLGIREDDTCFLCGQDRETLEHLFFACRYSREVLGSTGSHLWNRIPQTNIMGLRLSRRGTKEEKGVINVVINASIYLIWQQRNSCRIDECVLRPSKLVKQLTQDMKIRFSSLIQGNGDGGDYVRKFMAGDECNS